MMLMCNVIHLMLIKEHVYQCHEVLIISKLSIKKVINLIQMMKILNKMISVIAMLQLSNEMIIKNNI